MVPKRESWFSLKTHKIDHKEVKIGHKKKKRFESIDSPKWSDLMKEMMWSCHSKIYKTLLDNLSITQILHMTPNFFLKKLINYLICLL